MSAYTTPSGFLTVSGRWKLHAGAAALDKNLSPQDLSRAMVMFYAGFSAAMAAMLELADVDDNDEASRLLTFMHEEVELIGALARSLTPKEKAN